MNIKVSNLQSANYRPVPNQFYIETKDKTIFQSYDSIIVVIYKNKGFIKDNVSYPKVVLGRDWNYSRTTSKYRNQFLHEDTKTIKEKIAKGIYKVDNSL